VSEKLGENFREENYERRFWQQNENVRRHGSWTQIDAIASGISTGIRELLMDIDIFLIELRKAKLIPMIVDGQLAIAEESLKGSPVDLITKLTQYRQEIKSLLVQKEENGVKPYIDEDYNLGLAGKGCLVVPPNCKNRYKYWDVKTTYILLESANWLERYKKNDHTLKIKWEPLSLLQILIELGASEEFFDRYSKGNVVSEE
jgi:hypothetical protein